MQNYLGYKFLANLQIFWALCVISALCLGTYWTIYLYNDWQEKPVLTTVTTTALPVSQVPFPAVTICPVGQLIAAFNICFKISGKIV